MTDILVPRPKVKAALMLPTLYHRLPETEDSLAFALAAYEAKYGHGHIVRIPTVTRTLIDRARNFMVHDALKHYDPEFLIFADHDMFFPTGDVGYWRAITKSTLPERYGKVNFFERLLSHGPEFKIIGGLYRDKKNGVEYQCCRGHNEKGFNDKVNKGEVRGVLPDEWVATGAMSIHTDVTTALREAARLKMPEIMPQVAGRPYGFFSRNTHGHEVGEDVAFCLRAKQLGFQAFIDCDLRAWHQMQIWV